MGISMQQPSQSERRRGPSPDQFDRFEALFADELADIRSIADSNGVSLDDVCECYFAIVSSECDQPMVSHSDLQDALVKDGPTTWNIASVLVEFGEVKRSKGGGQWWWLVASDSLAQKCERRSISLQQYYLMRDDLQTFQDEVIGWYERRQMSGNLQERTMREIKQDHCELLHKKYFPETEFDAEGNLHDHPAGRYLKTAQDLIVEARGLSY